MQALVQLPKRRAPEEEELEYYLAEAALTGR